MIVTSGSATAMCAYEDRISHLEKEKLVLAENRQTGVVRSIALKKCSNATCCFAQTLIIYGFLIDLRTKEPC